MALPPPINIHQVRIVLTLLTSALLLGMGLLAIIGMLLRLPEVREEPVQAWARHPDPTIRGMFIFDEPHGATAPQRAQRTQNAHRRAQYLINAARRVTRAWEVGGMQGLGDAIEREIRYARQHLDATAKRNEAARRVGQQMRQRRGLLGWYAVMDSRTSAECRRANGRNFDPNSIPPIGYPGAVHPHCRCRAGVPFATAARVETIAPGYGRWAA